MSNKYLLLVGRVLLAFIFLYSGVGKFSDISSTVGMIAQAGLPQATALAWAAAIFEVVAGLAILAGFQTFAVSLVLAAFCLFTGFVFHGSAINIPSFSDGANGLLSVFNQIMLMKNITIAGGFLVLAASGPGEVSVDARLRNGAVALQPSK